MVWALRGGATDAGVVVPAEFVSICNNKGPFGLVTVTDRDRRLAAAKRSQSVTSRGRKLSTCYRFRRLGFHILVYVAMQIG